MWGQPAVDDSFLLLREAAAATKENKWNVPIEFPEEAEVARVTPPNRSIHTSPDLPVLLHGVCALLPFLCFLSGKEWRVK